MRSEPQAAAYRPDPRILSLATWLGDPVSAADFPRQREEAPPMLVIDEVERIWDAIAERDDWQPLADQVAAIRRLGDALGDAPPPAGHI